MPFDEDKKIEDNHSIEAKNISKASDSKILNTDQEDKKLVELVRLIAEKMGLSHFQQEIDGLKANDQYLATKLQEIAVAHDELVNILKGQNTTTTNTVQTSPNITTSGFDVSKLEVLGNIVNTVLDGYSKYKQATTPQTSFDVIDPEEAKKLFRESVLGDFETGKNMRTMLTTGLRKKVVNKAVSKILEDSHEPE